MSRLAIACVVVALIALVVGAVGSAPAAVEWPLPPARQEKPKYTGMAGCNTADCHGSDFQKPPPGKKSPWLNEYKTWRSFDPHSKAFQTLYSKDSKTIGAQMPTPLPKVYDSPDCLRCHTLHVPPVEVVENKKLPLQSGVQCEACHGPAEKWIDAHAKPREKNWSHEMSVAHGMTDLRNDLVVWASKCASCHLNIDPTMVKAGHPRLRFELVDHNEGTGEHWKTEEHPSRKEGVDARVWTVGQVVSLAEALRNLAESIRRGEQEELRKEAREQAAVHLRLLNQVGGFAQLAEIPAGAEKLDELAKDLLGKQAKTLVPADEALLRKLAAENPPDRWSFVAARQIALAFRALYSKKDDAAKAAIGKLCAHVAVRKADNPRRVEKAGQLRELEKAFASDKFEADFKAVREHFK